MESNFLEIDNLVQDTSFVQILCHLFHIKVD